MSDKKEIKIKPAKGRPMLTWVGKRPLKNVTAFPAQHVETYAPPLEKGDEGGFSDKTSHDTWKDWPSAYPKGGLLFHGDNKEVLAHLLANGFRGKVNLIYIDPPFDSGADYVRKVELRGGSGTAKVDGETYTLGEQIQYTDIWANDNYLQFMYARLLFLKELLANEGSLYLHCDTHRTHHLRCLLEEVFGADNLRNEIIWQRFNFRADGKKFGTVHDTLYFVTKSDSYHFHKPYIHLKPSYIRTHFRPDANGRLFRLDNLTAPAHGKLGKPLQFGDKMIDPPVGTMWRFAQEGIDDLWNKELIVIPEDGVPQIKRYLDEIEGQAVHSLWTDVRSINSQSFERTDYNTQKPEEMVMRLIETSSQPGDIILDCFIGSGKKLVKIIPFTHPLSPLDLEEIKRELEARPDEDRHIVAVCLGKELSADAWIEDWNRLRKGKNAVNKIEVIELRTDSKYGKFISHQPATAKVAMQRSKDKIEITVEDFISPTIIERLNMDAPVFKAKITDWRSMVDCIMIDSAYNGEVFNVTLSDVPEKKNDLVSGAYELPAPRSETTIAVKIIDMLGEEVVITKKV